MALDGIYLYSIVNELKEEMLNCRIDKINQPEKDEVILTFNKNRKSYKLLISASANYPRIHFTNISKPNPTTPPMFCMVLRKYLASARVLSVEQINLDRIVKIAFESTDELGFNSIYYLIIEIMGRHSNITLVRERDNVIMDSIKHITPDINSYRSLYTGLKYVSPPESNRLNLLEFSLEDLENYLKQNLLEFNKGFFSKVFTGVSSNLSSEMFFRYSKLHEENYNLEQLKTFIAEFSCNLKESYYFFAVYMDKKAIKDFHCTEFTSLSPLDKKTFSSPSDVLEYFYYEKDKADRLNSKSADLQKLVSNNIERCNKKIHILTETLIKCQDKDKLRLYGELLTANIYTIKKGMDKVELINYYSEESNSIIIPLDPNKTPSENIQKLYKKYNKLKKSEEMAEIQLKTAKEESEYLESVFTNILNGDNYIEIEEIRKELIESGYVRFTKNSKNGKMKNNKKVMPLHYISSQGNHIYVGKNNIQNDYLTLKFANKNDIWMHTKNIPGSHVIIKNTDSISNKTLEEAANLAAYYSKAKDSSKVPVDYTEVKNVKKPSGAKPGMVIYYTNETCYVDPQEPSLEKVDF